MKKKIIYLSIVLVLVISVVTLSSIYKSKDNKYKKEYNTIPKEMAIMIKEEGATDYIKSTSKDIPKGNYVLNRDKSYCKNNGKIGNYDSSLGKVSFSFIGTDSCYLYFDYEVPSRIGYEAILLDNGGDATTVDEAKAYIEGRTTSTTPDFSTVATTNEGMYAKEDDYTATTGMKSYYFRGAVNNNWVKFGKDSSNGNDIYWRIIRINGNGSIKMIYSGTTDPKNESSVTGSNGVYMTGTGTQINATTYKFCSSNRDPSNVGYRFAEGQQHHNGTSSDIKNTLENWYAGTTLEKDAATKKLVSQDQIFCNDRSATTSSRGTPGEISGSMSPSKTYYYGAYVRLETNKSPQLKCPTDSDKFTSNESKIGNKALEYPVGLITADEVAMAGGKDGSDNSSYYLYTNEDYWLGSPYYFHSGFAFEFSVKSTGFLSHDYVSTTFGARPVVSLSSKAKLSGNGTYSKPYTVS